MFRKRESSYLCCLVATPWKNFPFSSSKTKMAEIILISFDELSWYVIFLGVPGTYVHTNTYILWIYLSLYASHFKICGFSPQPKFPKQRSSKVRGHPHWRHQATSILTILDTPSLLVIHPWFLYPLVMTSFRMNFLAIARLHKIHSQKEIYK